MAETDWGGSTLLGITARHLDSSARTCEVVVIGGGIFGLFCALTLAEAGKSVIVVERGRIWSEASAVNAGSLAVQNKLPALVPFTLWAWEIWEGMADRLGAPIGLSREGGYKIAMSDAEAERLEKTMNQQRAAGMTAEWLTGSQLRTRAPWISPECVAATFSPDDGFASPTMLGPVLRRALEAAGVLLVENASVHSIAPGDTVVIETTRGRFSAESVAITAGAWTGRLVNMVGVKLPVTLDVNMVSVTEPAGPTIGNIVTHARGILTMKQSPNGSCLIGGGWQGTGTLDNPRKDVQYDQLVHNLRLAVSVVPGLTKLNVVRSWAGFEGVTPDSYPYLGKIAGHPNLYCAACARGGFTMGPALGRLLAELMLDGSTSKPIELFNPGRFAHATA